MTEWLDDVQGRLCRFAVVPDDEKLIGPMFDQLAVSVASDCTSALTNWRHLDFPHVKTV